MLNRFNRDPFLVQIFSICSVFVAVPEFMDENDIGYQIIVVILSNLIEAQLHYIHVTFLRPFIWKTIMYKQRNKSTAQSFHQSFHHIVNAGPALTIMSCFKLNGRGLIILVFWKGVV